MTTRSPRLLRSHSSRRYAPGRSAAESRGFFAKFVSSTLHLRRQNPRNRFAHFHAVRPVQPQCQLRLHQPIRNPRVVPLTLVYDDPVLVRLLPQVLLGGRQLDLAFVAQVVADEVLEAVEDPRPEHVNAEVREVVTRW